MSSKTHSDTLLKAAVDALTQVEARRPEDATEVRLSTLELLACEVAGIDYGRYRAAFGLGAAPELPADALRSISQAISASSIPLALALAALSETVKDGRERQTLGSHFTDFRLAHALAEPVLAAYAEGMTVVDPAAGSGILLAAVANGLAEVSPALARNFIRSECFAGDVQPIALRGLRLSLTVFAHSLADVRELDAHLFLGDSLSPHSDFWHQHRPSGFDFVIANPPWERLRSTAHEVIERSKTYGEDLQLTSRELALVEEDRRRAKQYATLVSGNSGKSNGGDPDLYRLFTEWSLRFAARPGLISLLVPAGLIRSKTDKVLRAELLDQARTLEIKVFDNRSKFFAIDSRFKFLHVVAELGKPPQPFLTLNHALGDARKVYNASSVKVPRALIANFNDDLTIPELRTEQELDLYTRMFRNGTLFGDALGQWKPHVVREVDMTRNRRDFVRERTSDAVPVIEGRMVHQFRSRAKRYVSGSGRSATWEPSKDGSDFAPQFWMEKSRLPPSVAIRSENLRAGFCDITGQTNERTLLAAAIPPGVVSGNKVPTIQFDSENHEGSVYLWTAIANSFAVDWALRRSMTTTLNFFILKSLIMPLIESGTPVQARLIRLGQELADISALSLTPEQIATRRLEVDVLVFEAFQLNVEDVRLIMGDFPLLDRSQPALPGEARSSVTRDTVVSRYAQRANSSDRRAESRRELATELGAVSYKVGAQT